MFVVFFKDSLNISFILLVLFRFSFAFSAENVKMKMVLGVVDIGHQPCISSR